MRAAKIGYIIISVALCVLGTVLIAVPGFSAKALGIICGILLILFGAVRIAGYFSRDLYRLAFQYDLPLGFLLIALGVIILSDSLFKIQIAIDSKRFGLTKWWLILAFAVLTGICGLALMFRPGEGTNFLMIMLGITLLFEGILNISTVITAVKIVKNQKPDVIEIDYEERKD